jgi:hypothetical protein
MLFIGAVDLFVPNIYRFFTKSEFLNFASIICMYFGSIQLVFEISNSSPVSKNVSSAFV